MTSPTFTPYTTGESLFGSKPAWVSDPLDQQRLQSYLLYEQVYWNVPNVFVLSQRGTNDKPIYIPSGRTIVDTSNRYTGAGYSVSVASLTGTDTNDVIAARLALSDLMARERFKSKYRGAKRYCQIQGDWVWHLTADPDKPVGTRLSLSIIDPGFYFPVPDPGSVDRIIAVMLAEPSELNGDPVVRRVCYRKTFATATTPASVTVEEAYFEVDAWQDLEATPVEDIRPMTPLPEPITSIPVYHIKNFEEPGNMFGSSELRGIERLIAALHQTISDEDLTLAMQGLGMYRTNGPQPVDADTRKPVPWKIGPGSVVHHPMGTEWERVAGVTSVAPFGDHYNRLWEAAKQATGSPDVAIGTVDVQIAQSGIALALQLSPIVAKSAEKNDLMSEVLDQMWFDIVNAWYPAFEETTFNEVTAKSTFGDAVPVDRDTRFKELNDMLLNGVIDDEYYRQEAMKLGYVFPKDMGTRSKTWRDSQKAAVSDPFADRVDADLGGNDGNTGAA
jgi:hypothetical protein